MKYYVNKRIKDLVRISYPEGRDKFVRLDQNENPDGLPKWFFEKVSKKITPQLVSMYPEEGWLAKKYAKYINVKEDNLCFTDGSLVGMGYIFQVFGEENKEVMLVNPTFNMYRVYANLVGMKQVDTCYKKDFSLNTKEILNKINKNTGLIILVNPNMPMGNAYDRKDLISIIKKAKKLNKLVLIDEAYYYFYTKSSVDLIKKYDNVLILRTFSKMLSIPGLRMGVIISNPTLIKYIKNLRPHYTINAVALAFGESIIDESKRLIPELTKIFNEGKEYLYKGLKKNKYKYIPSEGCFTAVKTKTDCAKVYEKLKANKVLTFLGKGVLDGYLRVTIANKKYMKIFLDTLIKVDK